MEPLIRDISNKKLIGMRLKMSLSDNQTSKLWQNFIPQKHTIKHTSSTNLYSIQIYDSINNFTPETIFEAWAAVSVNEQKSIPEKMDAIEIPKGKYAVFTHIGTYFSSQKTMRYIYGVWIPNSNYQLDKRPHFQIMDKNYNPNNIEAKETIWVPIY